MYGPLLCYPPPTLLLGRMLPAFFIHLAARSSTVLPLPLGQMRPILDTVGGAILDCATPPTLVLGQMLPVFCTVRDAILYGATPLYTTVGADAARFLYDWLRDPLLCYPPNTPLERPFTVLPPYTAPKSNFACFGAMSVGVLGDPSRCYPLWYT